MLSCIPLAVRKLIRNMICAVALMLTTTQAFADGIVHREDEFSIVLPVGFKLEKQHGVDFDLYWVTNGGASYVGMYVGTAPNEAVLKPLEGEQTETLATERARITTVWNGDELRAYQVLMTRLRNGQVVNFIQAWTVPDAPSFAVALRIVSSLKINDICSKRDFFGFCVAEVPQGHGDSASIDFPMPRT